MGGVRSTHEQRNESIAFTVSKVSYGLVNTSISWCNQGPRSTSNLL